MFSKSLQYKEYNQVFYFYFVWSVVEVTEVQIVNLPYSIQFVEPGLSLVLVLFAVIALILILFFIVFFLIVFWAHLFLWLVTLLGLCCGRTVQHALRAELSALLELGGGPRLVSRLAPRVDRSLRCLRCCPRLVC